MQQAQHIQVYKQKLNSQTLVTETKVATLFYNNHRDI